MKRLSLGLIMVILISGLIFNGCAEKTPATTTAPTTTVPTTKPPTTAPTTATTTTAPTTPAAPTGEKYGGIYKEALTVGPARPIGYPPEAAPDSYTCAKPALERLFAVKKDGSIVGMLATSWKVADDGKSITLGLRKGVKFHDGSDFNADVCKWNLDLEIAAKQSGAAAWKSIDKIDDYTIRINLEKYDNTVLTGLGTGGVAQQISKASFDKNGIEWARWNPVGTGPFIFVSYERDAKLTYKRNPNYWETGKPYLDGTTMTVIADATVRKLAFLKGDLSVLVASGLAAQELHQAGYFIETSNGATALLVPDSMNPKSPWANVNARFAASYALDRDALADALGFGFAIPAYQLYPSFPDVKIPNLIPTEFNQVKAKELLTQAGYPSGFKTTLHSFIRMVPNDYINAVAAQLRAVGIDVTTDFPTSGKYDNLRYKGWNDGLLGHYLASYDNKNQSLILYFSGTGFVSLKMPLGFEEGYKASLTSRDYDPKLVQAVLQLLYDDMTVIPYMEIQQTTFYRNGVHNR
jgi:peptide/nickel transport system substrate-binding protein